MTKLLSVQEVRDLWPDPKPTLKALKRLAKDSGLWIKVGRAIGLPEKDLDRFLAHLCSSSTETPRVHTGMYAAPSPDVASVKAQKLLTEAKQRRIAEKETPNYSPRYRLGRVVPLHGAKR
jgi:hypothetical protein